MIFADKLIELRKRAGFTQEELAEKMDVSRQSIAKWEGKQSVPELNKIIKLSELFGVSIDYLLKDEIEIDDYSDNKKNTSEQSLRRVSMEEANSFISSRKKASKPIATAILLCILSPITLIFLSCMTESAVYPIKEGFAVGFGMLVLLLLVAVSVTTFISVGNKNSQYQYLGKELIDTDYGVDGMVKELRSNFKTTYDKCNIIGVVICIVAVLPIFLGIMINENSSVLMGLMVCLSLLLVAVGVYIFVRVGVIWAIYEKLLQDGEYSKEKKKENNSIAGAVSSAYWLISTAIYLTISFKTKDWNNTWIIWVVAGILYPAIFGILRSFSRKEK